MFEKLAEKMKAKNRIIEEEEIEFKNLEEATEATSERPQPIPQEKPEKKAVQSSIEGSNIELKVVRPEAFGEVSTIADYLLDGCTVVLNTELLDRASIIRMLDFLNGVTYTMDGEIKNVAPGTYIITPSGIDIKD